MSERRSEMRFFVPGTEDEAQAQHIWDATKKFAEETLKWKVSDRRIFSLAYTDNRKNTFVEVGKADPDNGETVLVILETNGPYLVCTRNRGVQRDMPLLVGKDEAYKVTDFEE
jgi:hypothetical protein